MKKNYGTNSEIMICKRLWNDWTHVVIATTECWEKSSQILEWNEIGIQDLLID